MTITRDMMRDDLYPGFDPHGKDWGTAIFLSAFGAHLPPERVKEIIEAAAKKKAEPQNKEGDS